MSSRSTLHQDDLRECLLGRPEVITAYLFGSAVTPGVRSRDVDVAVVLADGHDDLATALGLQASLESSLATPVDLHEFDRLPVNLQFRVIQKGTVLVDRDPIRRVRAEIDVFNAYNDFRPYLDRIRTAARGRLATRAQGG